MGYCAYLRGGQFLSLIEEGVDEGVWLRLTESQRHMLLHTLKSDVDYQRAMAQYPRTTLIEVQLDVLPWESAPERTW
jgi:hypothetical protein